jgi:hypothetical protein
MIEPNDNLNSNVSRTQHTAAAAGPRDSIRVYARFTGLLMLVTLIFGYFGEAYVPSKMIAARDAAATATNIMSSPFLFRLGFASYLIEAVCDITLALLFYVLLRPVNKNLALLAAFFGLVSTAVYAIAELFYFSALIILRSADALKAFSPDQLNALALLSLKLFGNCGWIFLAFYGIASLLRGYLIFRSGYLPKFLGVLLMIGGVAFIAKNFTAVLAPAYSSNAVLLVMAPAGLALTAWLLTKGVDIAKWRERAAGADASL